MIVLAAPEVRLTGDATFSANGVTGAGTAVTVNVWTCPLASATTTDVTPAFKRLITNRLAL
jgi:hypothetical protein